MVIGQATIQAQYYIISWLYGNDTSTILYNLIVICQRYKHDIIQSHGYRLGNDTSMILYNLIVICQRYKHDIIQSLGYMATIQT